MRQQSRSYYFYFDETLIPKEHLKLPLILVDPVAYILFENLKRGFPFERKGTKSETGLSFYK